MTQFGSQTPPFALPDNVQRTGTAMLLTLRTDLHRRIFAPGARGDFTKERTMLRDELERRLGDIDALPGIYYVRDAALLKGSEFEPDPDEPSYAGLTHRELLTQSTHEHKMSVTARTAEERQAAVFRAQAINEELLWRIEGDVQEHYEARLRK